MNPDWYARHPGWTAAPGSPERQALDAEMIEHPERWPMGSRLFLKRRRGGTVEAGALVFADSPLTVHPHAGLDAIAYGSVAELLDAGWTVD